MAGVVSMQGRVNSKVDRRAGWDRTVKGYTCLRVQEFCFVLVMGSQQHLLK